MASGLQVARLEPAYLGQDSDSAPAALQRGKAALAQNFLGGSPGRLLQRGPVQTGLSYGFADKRAKGILYGLDLTMVGFGDHASATRVIEPHVAPYKPSADTALAKAYPTNLKAISRSAVASSVAPTNRQSVPGPRQTRFGKFVYAIGYDSDDDTIGSGIRDNGRGGYERLTHTLRWNAGDPAAANTSPVAYTFGGLGCQDIRVHYAQLLFLGGVVRNLGSTITHNRIWYTRPLSIDDHDFGWSPKARTVAGSAPDDTNSETFTDLDNPTHDNVLDLPDSGGDFGVALVGCGKNLAVLCRRHVYLLTGNVWYPLTSANGELRTASNGIGCLDPRSVVENGEVCFFLSQAGYMMFDGVNLRDVSKGLHRTLMTAAFANVGDQGRDGGFARAELLADDFLLLTIGYEPYAAANPSAPVVEFCALLDLNSGAWTNFNSDLYQTTGIKAPTHIVKTDTQQHTFDHSNRYSIPNLTLPENQAAATRGIDGVATAISKKWHSRLIELAAPLQKAQLHRVIVDYEAIPFTGTPADPLTVTIVDGSGVTIGSSWTLPAQASSASTNEYFRTRYVKEIFLPCNEIQVRIEAAPSDVYVELSILDVWIEFEVTHERT